MPRGTGRKITILVLIVIMVVLAILAVIVLLGLNRTSKPSSIAVDGAKCDTTATPQCQASLTGGNTGYLCTCTASIWRCNQLELTQCPTGQGSSSSTSTSSDSTSSASSTSSSPTSAGVCTVDTTNSASISLGASCPTSFSYKILKHVVAAPAGTTDAACLTETEASPEEISAVPGQSYAPTTSQCGQCVKLELLSVPTGTTPSQTIYEAAAYSGACSASSSSSSTSSAASTSSTSSSSSSAAADDDLPDTGLFDDSDSRPLLIGLLLILGGVVYHRFTYRFNWMLGNTPQQKQQSFEQKVTANRRDSGS